MGATMDVGADRRHSRSPSRLAVLAVAELRRAGGPALQATTFEQMLHGPFQLGQRFAAGVAAAVQLNDRAALEKLMTPVEAALSALPPVEYSDALELAESAVDGTEDETQARWLSERSREARLARIRALDAYIAAATTLRRALVRLDEAERV